MAEEEKRFYGGPIEPTPMSAQTARGVYVYSVEPVEPGEPPVRVAVEVVEGGGNVPRTATSFTEVAAQVGLDSELRAVAAVARTVLQVLTELKPGALEIEFGVELGGEMGIPLVTKGEAKANFKVTLKWEDKEAK